MQPAQLRPTDFDRYPPQARSLLVGKVELLRSLPLAFLPLLLRESRDYDWKFPMERDELDRQFTYLSSQSNEQLTALMKPFVSLQLTAELVDFDWVNNPVQFSEKLSAYLWATHQMDTFRKASIDYMHAFNTTKPAVALPTSRLTVVAMGQGVAQNSYPLFRKLRKHGTYYTNVAAVNGLPAILKLVSNRADRFHSPLTHFLTLRVCRMTSCKSPERLWSER
jgi:hypothetical protein